MEIQDYSIFSDFYSEERINFLLPAIISKWSNKYEVDIYEEKKENSKSIFTYICHKNSQVKISGHNNIFLSKNDVFVISESLNHDFELEEMFELKTFYYSDKILSEEEQKMNKYVVYATLSDKYALNVRANSEEEAYQKAYSVNIREWEHLITKPELKESVRVPDPELSDAQRWSKWGDFSIVLSYDD